MYFWYIGTFGYDVLNNTNNTGLSVTALDIGNNNKDLPKSF